MRRGDDQPALFAMRLHDAGDLLPRGAVERCQRLVEQPQRPEGDKKPGQRCAPLLTGGERAKGGVEGM